LTGKPTTVRECHEDRINFSDSAAYRAASAERHGWIGGESKITGDSGGPTATAGRFAFDALRQAG
jgi:hypothetical protein